MKRVILLLFVGLVTLSVSAQEKTAKIEFKSETIDYGEIAKGSDGVRVFEFTNNGEAPLVAVVQFLKNQTLLSCLEKLAKFR